MHTTTPPMENRTQRVLLAVAMAGALALLPHLGWYAVTRDAPRLGSALLLVLFELPIQWLALTALFTRAQRGTLEGIRLLMVGVVVSIAIGLAMSLAFYGVAFSFPDLGLRLSSTQPLQLSRVLLFGATQGVTHFGLWALAFLLPVALEDARVRHLQAEALKLEAEQLQTAAELDRLRSNLQPHFLLNTLNAIAGLVTEEPKQARQLLVALGDLLRDALKDQTELEQLSSQVSWLQRYAQILEARHRGDLGFTWDIGDGTGELLLPRLLLQPLVENAVKHGALKHVGGPGRITVKTSLSDAGLLCSVEDNGPGFVGEARRDGGFGLESVRRRVQLRYGERARVHIESFDGGTRATVQVPREVA